MSVKSIGFYEYYGLECRLMVTSSLDTVCDIKYDTNTYRDGRRHRRFKRTIERRSYGTWPSRSAALTELQKIFNFFRLPSTQDIRIYLYFF